MREMSRARESNSRNLIRGCTQGRNYVNPIIDFLLHSINCLCLSSCTFSSSVIRDERSSAENCAPLGVAIPDGGLQHFLFNLYPHFTIARSA